MYNSIVPQLEISDEEELCSPEPKEEGTEEEEENSEEESDREIFDEEGLGFTEDSRYVNRWVPSGQW